VSTASTKSNRKTQNARTGARAASPPVDATPPADISESAWWIAAVSILLIAAFLRLYDLPLVPFHHDEGVNGNFLVQLVRDGYYHYNPENYHGPALYYFAAMIPWAVRLLFGQAGQNTYGLTTFNARLVPALFGLATIWLVLLLRRRLGTVGTLAAALLLAISPGAVYLSRYFIHESQFLFFTLAIVVAALKYYEESSPVYLVLAAASLALLFATKETWIISVGVLAIALVTTHVYVWFWRSLAQKRARGRSAQPALSLISVEETVVRLGGLTNIITWSVVALAVLVSVGILFYSSFFTNWQGVTDSVKAFTVWSKTGQEAHVHPATTYLIKWLPFQEAPLLVIGAIGAALALWKPKNPFALFCGLWAVGIIAAYSLIRYKTPWLMLSFLAPLALIAGYAVEWLYQLIRNQDISRTVGIATVLVVWCVASGLVPNLALASYDRPYNWKTVVPLYQMVDLNFLNYDNDNEYYVYVYAHTRRDLLKLIDDINLVAQHGGTGADTGITIVSPDYWPLPWYFRDYKRVGYFGHMSATTEPVVIASQNQRAEVQAAMGDRYRQINSSFALRPGVDLLLFVRRDVAEP
jgi:uncharacterized protein (TIGR03663 family)